MSGTRTGAVAALVLLLAVGPAVAEEGGLTGSARVGWRFLEDEREGRFPQDQNLRSGPRLFDLGLDFLEEKEGSWITEARLEIVGAGDPSSDYLLSLRRGAELKLDLGYRRDDYSYRATGDPFPYETLRERGFVRGRWSPTSSFTLRFGWGRDTRRGESLTSAYAVEREVPPSGEIDERVRVRRPLDRAYDDWTLGVDYSTGVFRFGITESLRVGRVEDERFFTAPGEEGFAEALRRDTRSRAHAAVAKAGATLADGLLDLQLFLGTIRQPVRSQLSGTETGFSNLFVPGGPQGGFTADLSGHNRHRRETTSARLEAWWRPHPDWEATFSVEHVRLSDTVRLRLLERREFARPDLEPEETETSERASVLREEDRVAADLLWQVAEELRLRLAEEYYAEELSAPPETRGGSFGPSEFRSRSFRHTLGADWEPSSDISLSALGRYSENNEPHASVSAERAEEASLRARVRLAPGVRATGVYRRKGFHHSASRDSDSRMEALSGALEVAGEEASLSLSLAHQAFRTRTGTRYFDFDVSPVAPIEGAVSFRSRDLIATLDAHWEVTPETRLGLLLLATRSRGDFGFDAHEVNLEAEHDFTESLGAGLRLRRWRYDERDAGTDDYGATAIELYLIVRF